MNIYVHTHTHALIYIYIYIYIHLKERLLTIGDREYVDLGLDSVNTAAFGNSVSHRYDHQTKSL